MKKMFAILILAIIIVSTTCLVFAAGEVKDLHDASGLKLEYDGKLIDTYDNNKEIGNVTPIESVDEGEDLLYSLDPNLLEDTLSPSPLVTEYIVESGDSETSGIYFMFGHDGDIFLGFVKTENMGSGMLKRLTEFGKYNGVVK